VNLSCDVGSARILSESWPDRSRSETVGAEEARAVVEGLACAITAVSRWCGNSFAEHEPVLRC